MTKRGLVLALVCSFATLTACASSDSEQPSGVSSGSPSPTLTSFFSDTQQQPLLDCADGIENLRDTVLNEKYVVAVEASLEDVIPVCEKAHTTLEKINPGFIGSSPENKLSTVIAKANYELSSLNFSLVIGNNKPSAYAWTVNKSYGVASQIRELATQTTTETS